MPLFASEHAYIVSDIIPNLGVIPNLRCPDDSIYTKASKTSCCCYQYPKLCRCKTTHSTWERLRPTLDSGKPSLDLFSASSTSTWTHTCPIWKQSTSNHFGKFCIRYIVQNVASTFADHALQAFANAGRCWTHDCDLRTGILHPRLNAPLWRDPRGKSASSQLNALKGCVNASGKTLLNAGNTLKLTKI